MAHPPLVQIIGVDKLRDSGIGGTQHAPRVGFHEQGEGEGITQKLYFRVATATVRVAQLLDGIHSNNPFIVSQQKAM